MKNPQPGVISRRSFIERSAVVAGSAAFCKPQKLFAQMGAPAGSPDAYAVAKPDLNGIFEPTWDSLREHYHVPAWLNQAKFGIFIHWGLYSIPAHGNEWYIRHMYTADAEWHTKHYGRPDKFGYKDFIPMFTTPKFDADVWANIFRSSGARYVVPVAEHHDGFAMWNSDLTPWCAGKMGPRRDLIGELATAIRKQGLIFGLSNHRMEHHCFAYPKEGVPNDQFDARYAGFYGPPIPGDMNDGKASKAFQEDWLARFQEQVDKYHPQLVYFDNGVNPREYDDVKLRAAAYYYNRAEQLKIECTLATKDVAYYFGSIQDFEKASRAPKWIYPAAGWQCDDCIGSTWGYTDGMTYRSASSLIQELIEMASMGGNLLLNISPMGDGSIPEEQQKILLQMGEWLAHNGEGIYGSHPWIVMGEGGSIPDQAPGDWKGGSTAVPGPRLKRIPSVPLTEHDFRFTKANGNLYAFGCKYAGERAEITTLAAGKAKVEKITWLGEKPQAVAFHQTSNALVIDLPLLEHRGDFPYVLRVEGNMPLGS
jgi:alpha-L-fucosidase